MRPQWKPVLVAGLLFSAACGTETVVHNLEEKEANQIIELLAESDISGTKGMIDTGRSVSYTISVPAKSRLEAIKLLNRYEMPRRRDMGYNEIFKDSGLIPTAAEEKSKQLAALEGEIERQLKLVDGILDVQVQIVQPEETALRTVQEVRPQATASVTVRYLPGYRGARPLSEPQIQAIVAAGVERLAQQDVVVVMTPAGPLVRNERAEKAEASGNGNGNGNSYLSEKNVRLGAFVAFGIIIFLSLILLYAQMRLRVVRGRLTRLQTEIAKARRKPTDMPPNGG